MSILKAFAFMNTHHLPEGVELHSLPTVLDISTNKTRQDSTH